jgi:hypothetical protein
MHRSILSLACAAALALFSAVAAANGPPPHAGAPGHAGPPADRGPPAGARPDRGALPDIAAERRAADRSPPDHAASPSQRGPLGSRPAQAGQGRPGAGTFTPLPGQAGASHVAHVRFVVLDEDGEPRTDAAWGRMTWFWIGPWFDFVLNGHALAPAEDFVLVALAPAEGDAEAVAALCLASGTSNPGGNLHLLRSLELDAHLPADLDPAALLDAAPGAEAPPGVVLAVVPAAQVSCESDEEGSVGHASFGDDAVPAEWLVSVTDVHYLDSDLLDGDDGE